VPQQPSIRNSLVNELKKYCSDKCRESIAKANVNNKNMDINSIRDKELMLHQNFKPI
jgi:predicted nucleic acid-binding Zn ribbon protein